MIEIRPMDEEYIHWSCLHDGPVDPPTHQPGAHSDWTHSTDLSPHPWSDKTIAELAKKRNDLSHGRCADAAVEFMREMILRYGTCAILAWEEGRVVGHLRFYPMPVVQLLVQAAPESLRIFGATVFEPDPETLWVQCVMTCRPYIGPKEVVRDGLRFPSMEEAGARKGTGLKLARGLIAWASEHGWKRIVTQAHSDLDCMYGIIGGAGKAFWEKAGFRAIGSHYDQYSAKDDWKRTVESQASAKGMSKREAWTWYHMTYDL